MKLIKFIKSIFSDILSNTHFDYLCILIICAASFGGICWGIGWFSSLFDVVILNPKTKEPAYFLVGFLVIFVTLIVVFIILTFHRFKNYLKDKWKKIE